MPKPISILFVASEVEPFIKTGSLGDLAGNLPKEVKSMGHDIRVMLPNYSSINNRRFQIHNLLRMKDIEVPIADSSLRADIRSSYLNGENYKVLVYFIANDRYFNRAGLYFDPDTKKYFPDNDERFIFFCRGVLETLKRLQWQPDIIHCNDWQCGLIPAYLKSLYKSDPYFRNTKTVFTVFSLASHASFSKSSYDKSGLPPGMIPENGTGMDRLNFLKAGLAHADIVTTFGNKAEKSLLTSPPDDLGKILQARKSSILAIDGDAGQGAQSAIAQRLVDIYLGLAKSN